MRTIGKMGSATRHGAFEALKARSIPAQATGLGEGLFRDFKP
ncbi:MAG: hypothetical protein ACRD3O_06480 [Terriglobia bacterium]